MKLILILILALAGDAAAQSIQKWQTKDGQVVYGNAPPASAQVLGEYQSDRRTDGDPESRTVAPSAAGDDRFSVSVSNERRKLDRELKRLHERRGAIEGEIRQVESTRLTVQSTGWGSPLATADLVVDAANFQSDKEATLRRLRDERESVEADIAATKAELASLDERVRDYYDGDTPTWWRSVSR